MKRHRRPIPFAFTPIPNRLIESWLTELSHNELRVHLVIMRFTWGHGKPVDAISITQIVKMARLSRSTVNRAIRSLKDKGFLITTGSARRAQNYDPQCPRKLEIGSVSIETLPMRVVGSQL